MRQTMPETMHRLRHVSQIPANINEICSAQHMPIPDKHRCEVLFCQ